jgi:hypothetical protein
MSGGIGPLFSPHLIEESVLSVLMRWLPWYVERVEETYGKKLPGIESWGLVDEEDDRWPEQALPALIVVAEDAEGVGKYGEGFYRASWPFQVTVVVEHPERVWARVIARLFGAAVRGAILHRRDLGDAGRAAEWTGERNPFLAEKSRTEAANQNFFRVTQDEVVNWQLGPKTDVPPEELPSDGPEITEVDVDVEVK